MSSNPHKPMAAAPQGDSGEETLRLIAKLPAPQGLEARVHDALDAAPRSRRVLSWPEMHVARMAMEHQWLRAAAAAAIVFVVVGGGWGVYSHVEHVQNGKTLVLPGPVPTAGGFSGAGAMRTPGTIPGPTVAKPAKKSAAPMKKQGAQSAAAAGAQQEPNPSSSRP